MRLVTISLVVIASVAGIAFTAVYALSEWKLHRQYDAPLVPLRTTAQLDIAEGERMALIVGCWNGCHGPRGEGGTERIAGMLRQTAPTLSDVLPLYTDEHLARLIRYGVKHDGRSAVGMTSFTFWALGDQDVANIIGHLRQNQRS